MSTAPAIDHKRERISRDSKPYGQNPVFARIYGVVEWVCPACNVLHIDRIKAQYKALKCGSCDTQWQHGLVFYQSPTGAQRVPADTLIIGGNFAARRLVNRAYCESCDIPLRPSTEHKAKSASATADPQHAIQNPLPSKPTDE